jgi:pimeloyl-ACP methyl ester carboxylesterase/predicted Ser/Thr protein kinase
MRQDIRFCTAPDGVRIAYATSGEGPPLVKTANWLTHLEYDWESPIWRRMFGELSSGNLLVRYDDRGNGLSDWDAADVSFPAWVRDLEMVADAAGLERFALFGLSRGGAVAIEYAARHPERVSHLILLGAYCRGWSSRATGADAEIRNAMLTLMREGWGQDSPAFRQVWTSCFVPDGTLEEQRWFNELQRITTSPENAVRMQIASGQIDVTHRLAELRVPTLVCHSRGDAVVKFDHGRRIAASIPGARFVPLESRNHLLLEHEPACGEFFAELDRFLGTGRLRDVDAPSSASVPAVPLSEGSYLGHYRIAAPVGRGGMGMVYRAKDTRLGREVALKVLAASAADGDQARRWLLREARHAAVLNHPNVCTVFDVVQIAGRDLIVMELVTGLTLTAMLGDGPLPPDRLCAVGAQIAEAVDHAHNRGVIHGDLKSANVILTEDDRVKVLDFGVSRRLPTEGRDTATGMSPTSEGRIGGTPAYMSPELLRGDATDTRSDLWSLGVLLFESATGQFPFSGPNLYDLMTDIFQREPVLPPAIAQAPVGAVIRRCLEKDPNRRYQRGIDVRDALIDARSALST